MLSLTVKTALVTGANRACTMRLQTGVMNRSGLVTAPMLTRESGAAILTTLRTLTLISSLGTVPVAELSGTPAR